MSIVITGADGFLGGKITKYLLDHTDHDVTALSINMEWLQAMTEREGIEASGRLRLMDNSAFMQA